MREIKEGQRLSILNRAITILAEEPENEGAPASYSIRVAPSPRVKAEVLTVELPFQRGAVGVDGENVNGLSDEALIEVLINRLKAFQAGRWACETNGVALSHLESALAALEDRTARRRTAGVEGPTNLMPGERGHAT
jgi:hypothetical protein